MSAFEEAKKVAILFSLHFEINKSKNETRKLATNETIRYNLFLKSSSVNHEGSKLTCNSQKQLPGQELLLEEKKKVFQKLLLKVYTMFFIIFIV